MMIVSPSRTRTTRKPRSERATCVCKGAVASGDRDARQRAIANPQTITARPTNNMTSQATDRSPGRLDRPRRAGSMRFRLRSGRTLVTSFITSSIPPQGSDQNGLTQMWPEMGSRGKLSCQQGYRGQSSRVRHWPSPVDPPGRKGRRSARCRGQKRTSHVLGSQHGVVHYTTCTVRQRGCFAR